MLAFGRTGVGYERKSYRTRKRHHGIIHKWQTPSPVGPVRALLVGNVVFMRFPVGPRRRVPVRYVKVPKR